jgi:serine/threonine protein kinase
MESPTPEPMVCPDAQSLTDLLLGKLSGKSEERIRAHVRVCPACADFTKRFRELSETHATGRGSNPLGNPGRNATEPIGQGAAFAGFELPGYRIGEELGRGGMGVVFRAVQENLNRPVAVKMILGGALTKPDDQARFFREGETLAKFSHPNFVQVYEMGAAALPTGPQPYLVLEFVEGGNLQDWMRLNPLAPRDAAALVTVLARAMDVAHTQGIVHRDLKPANILLRSETRVSAAKASDSLTGPWIVLPTMRGEPRVFVPKISDFGLAKHLEANDGLTRTGNIMGTPVYMAPEQYGMSPRSVGAATDVYALGAILYECLTDRPPLQGNSGDTVRMLKEEAPPPPSSVRPQLPHELDAIALKCLEKDPARRYATAGQLADDLEAWLAGRPVAAKTAEPPPRPSARRGRPLLYAGILMGIVAASIAVTLVIHMSQLPPPVRAKEEPRKTGGLLAASVLFLVDLDPIEKINWPFRGGPPKEPKDDGRFGDEPPDKKFGKKKDKKGFGFEDELFGKFDPILHGDKVKVRGKEYPKGIYMHPPMPRGSASITFKVPKDYKTFLTRADYRDGDPGAFSPGIFKVSLDGELKWSHKVASQADGLECKLSIAGADKIKIEVDGPEESKGGHFVWIDPRMTKAED